MRAGIGELESIQPGYFVVNVSSINTHNMCDRRWYHERVDGRVPATEDTDFLKTGRAGHEAVEDLHNRMGEWDSNAAIGVARTHAERVQDEVKRTGHLMYEREREKLEWFAEWLPQALPIYAAKYKTPPWDEVLMVEKAVWLQLEYEDILAMDPSAAVLLKTAGFRGIIFVGRPDAVVKLRGKIWHVQRKLFSEQVDLQSFLAEAPFQKHEVLYLTIFQALVDQGDLPELPVGSTLFDLIRKLKVPDDPTTLEPPVKCKCGAADTFVGRSIPGEVTMLTPDEFGELKAHHPRMPADKLLKHMADEVAKQERFKERVERKMHEYNTWTDRAFLRHEAIITKRQRTTVMRDMVYDVAMMASKHVGHMRTTPKQGWACKAFHRPCPYVGVCAGRESIDGPQFTNRTADYTDVQSEE